MNTLTTVMLIFSILGAVDYILGNRFEIGKEFERAFMLFGTMALSMIGMIVLAPALSELMRPFFDFLSDNLGIDASIIPASLFANDMGGAPLAAEVAKNEQIGRFNALVVSSMMGCTVSFTVPFALGMVKKEHHRELLTGLLCGIVTIPVGSFISGIFLKIKLTDLLINLLPLICFSGVLAFCLIRFHEKCIKVFSYFGIFVKVIITVGLAFGIINFLVGKEAIPGLAPIEEGAAVCLNACIVLSGAFPLINIISKLLAKPLSFVGRRIGINEVSAACIISSLATSATTFGMTERMDKKGIVLNSAFAVSGAFTFGSHLAFTMAFDASYVPAVVLGKLVSGVLALIFAFILYKRVKA